MFRLIASFTVINCLSGKCPGKLISHGVLENGLQDHQTLRVSVLGILQKLNLKCTSITTVNLYSATFCNNSDRVQEFVSILIQTNLMT